MGNKHVHGTTTSLNGCKVEIDGDVVYTLIPPRITGFHGVVHISGGPSCPNGDLYFGIEPKDRVAQTLPVGESKP
jgi:hypothetical protein